MAENLSDALIMAGAILIFVIALTVSMSSFTTMRSQIDEIIEYDYKLDLVTDSSGKPLNYFTDNSDVREVGVETVISSMYRVEKENYIVYIAGLSSIPTGVKKTKLDEEQYYDANNNGTNDVGELIIAKNTYVIEIAINNENSNVNALLEGGLYDKLKAKKFKEYLGVYQQDTGADEVNKTTFRVITYVVQP